MMKKFAIASVYQYGGILSLHKIRKEAKTYENSIARVYEITFNK